ncbi:MAG: hypothetical protein PHD95_02315 [Candidatus ainarchaeum sp.]|nr:hypothetical protein [Candidatus ainarchaeum sp.]
MQLSKLEHEAIDALKKSNLLIFKAKDVSLLLHINKTKAYNAIKSLKKKQAIETVQAGAFALKGTSDFAMGCQLNWPSYISFWSALNYYGFSDQTPKKIFLASTKYKKAVKNFKYVTLSKKKFFGYCPMGDFAIADKEKAFIDSFLFPKYAGGTKEIMRALKTGLKEISAKKLANYAMKTKSKAAIRRLGFVLEENKAGKGAIGMLLKHKGKGFELFDPSIKRKNNFNKKWLLDINW